MPRSCPAQLHKASLSYNGDWTKNIIETTGQKDSLFSFFFFLKSILTKAGEELQLSVKQEQIDYSFAEQHSSAAACKWE